MKTDSNRAIPSVARTCFADSWHLALPILFLLWLPALPAQDFQFLPKQTAGPTNLLVAVTKRESTPRAVVIFCAGRAMRSDEQPLIKSMGWRDFSSKNKLELVQIWMEPKPGISKDGKSYLDGSAGAGKAIYDTLDRMGLKNCPIFFFSMDGPATRFVTSTLELDPKRVCGWATGAWHSETEIPRAQIPAVLIGASSSDHSGRLKDLFISGRRREVPLLWLEIAGNNSYTDSTTNFVKSYIEACVEKDIKSGRWQRISTGEMIPERDARLNREDSTWIPSSEVGDKYLALAIKSDLPPKEEANKAAVIDLGALGITVHQSERQNGLTKASVAMYTPSVKPSGTLIFCSGAVPKKGAEAAQLCSAKWREYAASSNMALVEIHYQSHKSLLAEKHGFTDASRGSGSILLEAVNRFGGLSKPIFLYELNPGGARFLVDFVNWKPELVSGWCMSSWVADNLPRKNVPGLIAAGVNSIDYDKVKNLFVDGRQKGLLIAWVSASGPDARKAELPEIAMSYFNALKTFDPKKVQWRSIDSREILARSEIEKNPADAAFFPDEKIGAQWAALTKVRAEPARVVEETVETKNPKQPTLRLYLRLPKNNAPVEGVLAFCTWENAQRSLVQRLLNEGDPLLQFADRHNLAVVTWATAQTWNTSKSFDELARKESRQIDSDFDDLANAWDKGAQKLCEKYHVPDRNWLLWGISRGAQWAHRLALRKPDRFLAVHVHINSSYDVPTEIGKQVLWFASTGELEGGYSAAKRFYHACRSMGYHITFKAGVSLGHQTSPQIEELRELFFEYALDVKKSRENQKVESKSLGSELNKPVPPIEFVSPPFVGDYINQDVVPSREVEFIPSEQQVPLPTAAFAEAWATPPQ